VQKWLAFEYIHYFEEPLDERTASLVLQRLQQGAFIAKVGDGTKTEYRRTSKILLDILVYKPNTFKCGRLWFFRWHFFTPDIAGTFQNIV